MAKVVTVEWMQATREFHCPCCAAEVLNAEGQVAAQPCSHFLFAWNGDQADFTDAHDNVEQLLDDRSLMIDHPLNLFLLARLPESATILEIEIRTEALGPVVQTDYVAFDNATTLDAFADDPARSSAPSQLLPAC